MDMDAILENLDKTALLSGCYLWIVRVTGKRNGFICGRMPDAPLVTGKVEIPLRSGGYKIIVQCNDRDPDEDQIDAARRAGDLIEGYLC